MNEQPTYEGPSNPDKVLDQDPAKTNVNRETVDPMRDDTNKNISQTLTGSRAEGSNPEPVLTPEELASLIAHINSSAEKTKKNEVKEKPKTREELISELKDLVSSHWQAMEDPESDRGISWDSYVKIKRVIERLQDRKILEYIDQDNYSIVNNNDPNFGLAGLPVIMAISKKYKLPIDQARYKKLQNKHKVQQKKTLEKLKKKQM